MTAGHAEALVVPELRQARANGGALRDLLEIGERDLVLSLDPRRGLGAVGILEPAIGIGDLVTVENLDDVALLGGGVDQRFVLNGRASVMDTRLRQRGRAASRGFKNGLLKRKIGSRLSADAAVHAEEKGKDLSALPWRNR